MTRITSPSHVYNAVPKQDVVRTRTTLARSCTASRTTTDHPVNISVQGSTFNLSIARAWRPLTPHAPTYRLTS